MGVLGLVLGGAVATASAVGAVLARRDSAALRHKRAHRFAKAMDLALPQDAVPWVAARLRRRTTAAAVAVMPLAGWLFWWWGDQAQAAWQSNAPELMPEVAGVPHGVASMALPVMAGIVAWILSSTIPVACFVALGLAPTTRWARWHFKRRYLASALIGGPA